MSAVDLAREKALMEARDRAFQEIIKVSEARARAREEGDRIARRVREELEELKELKEREELNKTKSRRQVGYSLFIVGAPTSSGLDEQSASLTKSVAAKMEEGWEIVGDARFITWGSSFIITQTMVKWE